MIPSFARRWADTRLRAENEALRDARDQARAVAKRMFHRLLTSREEVQELATELAEARAELQRLDAMKESK